MTLPLPRSEVMDEDAALAWWSDTVAAFYESTSATVNAQQDIHASAAYRRSLAGTMVERALQNAVAR